MPVTVHRLEKLQWGHGNKAVETGPHDHADHVQRCFNGATAIKPWRLRPRTPRCEGFDELQWGHGNKAVETG